MKSFKGLLAVVIFLATFSAEAVNFRIGPKVGLGIGTATGVKGDDTKIALAPILGALGQFDFGSAGIDIGANYRYNVYAFAERKQNDGDSEKDTITAAISHSALEIPVTAYYKLPVGPGFFKFGGGAGVELGFGKVRLDYQEENTLASDVSEDTKYSFSNIGLKQLDVFLIAALGYQFDFDSWALSIDFQPKYGLVNKVKNNKTIDLGKWHTLWFDLGVGFVF